MSAYYLRLLRQNGWPEDSIVNYHRFPDAPIARLYPLVQDKFKEAGEMVRPKARVKCLVQGKERAGILLSAIEGATRVITDVEIHRANNAKTLKNQRPGEGTLPGTVLVDWQDVWPEDGKHTPVV